MKEETVRTLVQESMDMGLSEWSAKKSVLSGVQDHALEAIGWWVERAFTEAEDGRAMDPAMRVRWEIIRGLVGGVERTKEVLKRI